VKHDAKRDANELGIVRALETIGCRVQRLSGGGMPDLLVAFKNVNVLVEVKMPKEKLNSLQTEWHAWWRPYGQVAIVESEQQAIDLVRQTAATHCPF